MFVVFLCVILPACKNVLSDQMPQISVESDLEKMNLNGPVKRLKQHLYTYNIKDESLSLVNFLNIQEKIENVTQEFSKNGFFTRIVYYEKDYSVEFDNLKIESSETFMYEDSLLKQTVLTGKVNDIEISAKEIYHYKDGLLKSIRSSVSPDLMGLGSVRYYNYNVDSLGYQIMESSDVDIPNFYERTKFKRYIVKYFDKNQKLYREEVFKDGEISEEEVWLVTDTAYEYKRYIGNTKKLEFHTIKNREGSYELIHDYERGKDYKKDIESWFDENNLVTKQIRSWFEKDSVIKSDTAIFEYEFDQFKNYTQMKVFKENKTYLVERRIEYFKPS